MNEPSNQVGSDEPQPRTLDFAIIECDKHILRHKIFSWLTLAVLIASWLFLYQAYKSQNNFESKLNDYFAQTPMRDNNIAPTAAVALASQNEHLSYLFLAAFIVVTGVLIALYRFHLVEITKNEQFKLGFWRIRIAANNTSAGFQTEVRRALTENAFSFETPRSIYRRSKEVESPLPGHPGSDLVTAVLNKVLNEVEFNPSKKQ
jgi:hypothetical protein